MAIDSSTNLLIQQLAEAIAAQDKPCRILFIADENTYDSLNFIKNFPEKHILDIVSNRYEVYFTAKSFAKNNVFAHFNDFDFNLSALAPSYDIFVYRISKEKLVVHHVLNSFLKLSPAKSQTLIAGEKKEGIKNYIKNYLSHDSVSGSIKKVNNDYIANLITTPLNNTASAFDTLNYNETQSIKTLELNNKSYEVFSKPGTYGWKTLDEGSQLLCSDFIRQECNNNHTKTQMIDLGCGSGLLSLAAHAIGISSILATDNNASALASAEQTFQKNHITATVIADDCARQINKKFDLLLCNPPFHKGFDTNNTLTEHFVSAARRLLKPSGRAYFVTNSFIGIESIAKQHFDHVKTLENNKRFKTLRFN